jgi:glycosyltransferase involved in cell wall biosynthesis
MKDTRTAPAPHLPMPPEAGGGEPDVSFVMPCYNEEGIVRYTVTRLFAAFERAGYRLELVAVDNGSRDRTGQILRSLAAEGYNVVPHRVEVNQGYGNGILAGLPLCTARWVGIIPADGQVDAEDVVRLFDALQAADRPTLGKVRRRFRLDGWRRKVVSVSYNLMVRLLWPRLESIDVNGSPKILPREALEAMHLESRQWFLDPEIMVKAHYMGLRVLELNVFARMRGAGVSHVQATTCWEFARKLIAVRLSTRSARWRRSLAEAFEQACRKREAEADGSGRQLPSAVAGHDPSRR